jgi:O-antigen biosynthesis protein
MKIALIYNFRSPHTTGAYFERVFKQCNIPYELFAVDEGTVIREGFDLYLRIDHGDYKFDIPKSLHPSVFYVIDTHLPKPYKKILRQSSHYDVIFCAQKDGALKLSKSTKMDVHWVPLAADPDIHKRILCPLIYDIGFVGRDAQKADRGRQLRLLRKEFPSSFIGQADFTKMGQIYSSSKIGFNSSIAHDINMRIFEIMACGCMLLTNRIAHNGFEELFEDGVDYVSYRTDSELISKARYYLEHEDIRLNIAQAGRKKVIEKHTYFHRLQTIFNYLAYKFGGEFNNLRI